MISVILPTFNEISSSYLGPIMSRLARLHQAEILVIDGGSTDGTVEFVAGHGVEVLSLPGSSRAARLNLGIEQSQGEMLLLHHPRSVIEPDDIELMRTLSDADQLTWGGFTHQFDSDHPLLRFTSWYSNHIRCDRSGIVYLDHCVFLSRAIKQSGIKIPDIDIFEDTELSKLLLEFGRPVRLAAKARTSAIRFRSNGMWRQSFLNQLLKIAYHLQLSPDRMNRLYEKGLHLNKE